MRDLKFQNGEYYHIYNRGVDKRNIFEDKNDLWRFVKGILIFNRPEVVGSIRDELNESHEKKTGRNPVSAGFDNVDFSRLVKEGGELIEIIAVCLNPNHFHLLVKQISDNGISKFMHKLGLGYTKYFNIKNERTGSLFQGRFKAKYIEHDDALTYVSAYINKNDKIHGINGRGKELVFSSWSEYCGENKIVNICEGKDKVLGQFQSIEDYKKYAKKVAKESKKLKQEKRQEYYLE